MKTNLQPYRNIQFNDCLHAGPTEVSAQVNARDIPNSMIDRGTDPTISARVLHDAGTLDIQKPVNTYGISHRC